MEEWVKVVIMGIVEGVTEFLPISSTGHLIVAESILDLRDSLEGVFEIFIQIGAVMAVIAFYWADLFRQARTITSDVKVRQLWLGVMVAFVPAASLGLLFDDFISEVLFSPTVVAIALILGGILFLIVERFVMPRYTERPELAEQTLEDVTLRQALIIGLWQVLALFPGMSRSGMSIIGAMISGLNRKVATQFSFYLALPTLGGATLYTLIRNLDQLSGDDLFLLGLGAVVSAIVAWLSIAWLLRYVANNNFIPFGIYRIVAGIAILVLVYAGIVLE